MYRDSVDTFARELQEVRAENERLRADLATAQRLARPRRWTRIAGACALVVVLAATCVSTLGYASASLDAKSRKALDEACWKKFDAQGHELARLSFRFHGRFEVDTLTTAIEECRRYWSPWGGASGQLQCSALLWTPSDSEMPWDTCDCH
jgi:hypothetical protein